MSEYHSDPAPRPPVDPRGAQTPPPPPPPGYGYGYPPPPPEKKGLFSGLTKMGGAISIALMLFIFGFYAAIIVMNQNAGPSAASYREGEGQAKIAILPIDGIITQSTAGFVRQVVDQIIKDDDVKAVVLRVDSPGGSVTPSDEIYRHIKRLKDQKKVPIVASYGSVAASGGYYVSCGADYIFLQPTTITGSIGVLGQVFTVGGMMDKIGVSPLLITSTESTEKDVANNTFRPWDERDIAKMTGMLDVMYDQFIDVVYEGRASHFQTREAVNEAAHGRVYTAQAAIDAKLTDEIGYLDAALVKARELGGIAAAEPPVVIYRAPAGLGDLFGVTARPNSASGWSVDLNIDAAAVRQMMTELSMPQPAYLMSP